jgi:hypothetical protein
MGREGKGRKRNGWGEEGRGGREEGRGEGSRGGRKRRIAHPVFIC